MAFIGILIIITFLSVLITPPVSAIKFENIHKFDDDFLLILSLYFVLTASKTFRKSKRFWVNSYLKERKQKGRYYRDYNDLRMNTRLFKENFRMTLVQFDALLVLLKPLLDPKKKSRKSDHITAIEKLCITLEYLASGTLQRHIGSIYRVSKQRLGPIIQSTCEHIYDALRKEHLTGTFNVDKWTNVSNNFNSRWNFPNCIGAIDGKHVAIKSPNNAASVFYNYKGFHSIVLLAVADAHYKFLYIDVGAYGSEGDNSVFQNCEFRKSLLAGKLGIPPDRPVQGTLLPHVFLADDAFPLHRNIMKPVKPGRKANNLSQPDRIFNYRLSRARRCIENAFGIMCARWICLARTMFMNPDRAQKVVAACCVLHNYLMKEDPDDYCPFPN